MKEFSRIELLQGMPIFGGIREDILQLLLELSPSVVVRKNRIEPLGLTAIRKAMA